MPRPSGLRIEPRFDSTTGKTQGFTICGTVAGVRIRRRAQSGDKRLAAEEAKSLEAQLLREAWHGERRGVRPFAEAALSYLEAAPRSARVGAQIKRILQALGDAKLGEVNQQAAIRLKQKMLAPEAASATYLREVLVPLRVVLNHAHRLGWCDPPHFVMPRQAQGRTRYLLPDEAERLIAAAAPHVKPLLVFLLGTGARISEALELDWRDVDLTGARAIFWRTKNGRRRVAAMPPRVVVALANLPHRDGRVFRWSTKPRTDGGVWRTHEYADRERRYGGHIKTAWKGALTRAGLGPDLTPHDLRHTWASWQYALYRDLLGLKVEGGWSSVALVERYAHLMPAGQETAIQAFWQLSGTDSGAEKATA